MPSGDKEGRETGALGREVGAAATRGVDAGAARYFGGIMAAGGGLEGGAAGACGETKGWAIIPKMNLSFYM